MALQVRKLEPGSISLYRPPEGYQYDTSPMQVQNAPTGLNYQTPLTVVGRPQAPAPQIFRQPVFGVNNNPKSFWDFAGNFGAGLANNMFNTFVNLPGDAVNAFAQNQTGTDLQKKEANAQLQRTWNDTSLGTLINQARIGMADNTNGTAQIAVDNQNRYLDQMVRQGKLSQQDANIRKAKNNNMGAANSAAIAAAEQETGTKYDPSAGVMAALDVGGSLSGLKALTTAALAAKGATAVEKGVARTAARSVEDTPQTPVQRVPIFNVSNGTEQVPVRTHVPGEGISNNYDVVMGSKAATKEPSLASQVTQSALNTKSANPVKVMVDVIANTQSKKTVRRIVNAMNMPVEGNVKNRLIRDLTEANTAQDVASAINKHIYKQDESGVVQTVDTPFSNTTSGLTTGLSYTRPKVSLRGTNRIDKPVVAVKSGAPSAELETNPYSVNGTGRPMTKDRNLLNIKIAKAKDPARKAELIAERDGEFGAPVSRKSSPIEGEVLSGDKKPGVLSRVVMSVSHNLKQFGTGGQFINKGIQTARNNYEKRIGKAFTDLNNSGFNRVHDKDFVHIVDAIENGTISQLSSHHQIVANAVVKALRDAHAQAITAGMKIGDFGERYFPHWFKDGDKSGVGLVERQFNQRYGNLERQRKDSGGGYEKNKESLVRYLQNAHDRISKAEQFGQNDEILGQAFEQASKEGYDARKLAEYAKTGLGRIDYGSGAHQVSSAVSKLNAITSLQKAFIANLSQGVNTAAITGMRNAGRAYKAMLSDPELRNWAHEAGVAGDHITGQIQDAYAGIGNQIGDKAGGNWAVRNTKKHVLVPGMQATEHFNRTHAVIAGKMMMERLDETAAGSGFRAKNAQRLIGRFVEDYKPGQRLTTEQIKDGAREVVKRSQFKVDPIDLPGWASGPVGKLIAQFRSFGYKQTQFLAREVIGEAMHGNIGPLIRFTAVGVPTGFLVEEGRKAVTLKQPFTTTDSNGDERTMSLGDAAAEGTSNILGGALAVSQLQSLGDDLNYNKGDKVRQALAVGGDVLGPTAGNVVRGGLAGIDASEGRPRALQKFGASKIPVVGGTVAGALFPTNADSQRYAEARSKAEDAIGSNKRDKATFDNYLARNKNPETGKSIQLSPAESMENSRSLFDNDKLRQTVANFERSANKKHDPLWDLSDERLKQFMQYGSQYTGDPAKSNLYNKANLPDGSNWIDNLKKARNEFYGNKDIRGNSEPNVKTPPYPTPDQQTKDIMATYNASDSEGKSKLMDAYGDKITKFFNDNAVWTNAMRRAEGAPEKNDFPVQSDEVKKIMNTYYSLPTHDGKRGGNASRYAWVQAHPDDYKKMQDYMSQSSLYKLINEASDAQFKGTQPSQELLKAIKNVGSYDIATYTDKDGNTVYGLNPQDAYAQNNGSSSSSSSGGKYSSYRSKSGGRSSGSKSSGINPYGYQVKRGTASIKVSAPVSKKSVALKVPGKGSSKPKVSLKKAVA